MKNCKKTLRRGLALFVALVMCLSVMSITAYAEEVVPEPETLTEEEEPAEEIQTPADVAESDEDPTPIEGETLVEDEGPALARSLLPSAAFAAGSFEIYADQCYLNEVTGNYFKTIDAADSAQITPAQNTSIGSTSDSTINLWVYSKAMEEAGKKDGGAVPYYKDQKGQTWQLNKIMWGTSTRLDGAKVVMSAEQTASATSKDGYNFSTSELKGASGRKAQYHIIYLWELSSGGQTPENPPEQTTYTVSYNFNLSGASLFAIQTSGRLDGGDGGIGNPPPPDAKVNEGAYLPLEPHSDYVNYLKFTNYKDLYLFNGWKINGEGDTIPLNGKVPAAGDMLGQDGKITLVADWRGPLDDITPTDAMPDLTSQLVSPISKKLENGEFKYPIAQQEVSDDTIQYNISTYLTHPIFRPTTNPLSTIRFHITGSGFHFPAVESNVTFGFDCEYADVVSIGGYTEGLTVPVSYLMKDGKVDFDVILSADGTNNSLIEPIKLDLPLAEFNTDAESADFRVSMDGSYNFQIAETPYGSNKNEFVEKMLKQEDWKQYFAKAGITDVATQFLYAMSRANQLSSSDRAIHIDAVPLTAQAPVKMYTVTFNPNGGAFANPETPLMVEVEKDEKVPAPADPTCEGYTFDGWYLEDARYNFDTPVKKDITLIARWTEIPASHTHSPGDWGESTATCTASGMEVRRCTECGQVVETRTVAALGHDWGEWETVTEPTTTSEGREHRLCARCDLEETRPLAMLPVPPVTPVIPPVTPPVTPVTPPTVDPGTNIPDEEVPLANVSGLNDVDHFAYIAGYEDGTVRPTNNITRAEVATIFFRLMTEEYRVANWSTSNTFTDANPSGWYNAAISTAAKAGILKGYADGSVKPNANITRAEFAAIAARFISNDITDDGAGDFSDTANHWAAKEIRLAAKAGWVQGDGGRFRPDDPITRAEVMIMVNRMLDRVPDADHMLPGMKTWSDNPAGTWYYAAVQEATNDHAYERAGDGVTEIWMELTEERDWAALEAEWAANNGASKAETQGLPNGI